MTNLTSLRNASSLNDLAALLAFKPKAMAYVLYKMPSQHRYRSFVVTKRSGSPRHIDAPCDELALLQTNLSNLLQDCIEELSVKNKWSNSWVHGFMRERSIMTNAFQHRHRQYVFNLDLSDFFPSINFGRVYGYLQKNKHFALHKKVAEIIAHIACYNGVLPQGSPCSPVLSNLIAQVLDVRLVSLAAKTGTRYSRYADDLSFSTNKKLFPVEIACLAQQTEHVWLVGHELTSQIRSCGFSVNDAKTRMQYKDSRQMVTGLVVNEKVNIKAEYRKATRAMADHLFRSGSFRIPEISEGTPATLRDGTRIQLHGRLGHIDSVDRLNSKLRNNGRPDVRKLSSKEDLYRRFLIFDNFYAALRPTLICEGKTDAVYLKSAIVNLRHTYPTLADPTSAKLAIRLFKYPQTSTGEILQLEGGCGDLRRFWPRYLTEIKRFKAPGANQPVMVLVDNDAAGREVISAVCNSANVKADYTLPFVHVGRNLYLLWTPLRTQKQESSIEDCFDEQTLAKRINNKTFNRESIVDSSLHYGKATFAAYVENAASNIDFSGFATILENISAAIAHKNNTP